MIKYLLTLLVALSFAGQAMALETVCWHQPDGHALPSGYIGFVEGESVSISTPVRGDTSWSRHGKVGYTWCTDMDVTAGETWDIKLLWAGGVMDATQATMTTYEDEACRSDTNENGGVSLGDVADVTAAWNAGPSCIERCREDINADGGVSQGDVADAMGQLGEGCTQWW